MWVSCTLHSMFLEKKRKAQFWGYNLSNCTTELRRGNSFLSSSFNAALLPWAPSSCSLPLGCMGDPWSFGILCMPLGALTHVALCSCLCAEFSYSLHQTGSCLKAETVLSQLLKYVVCARQLNRSWITLIQTLNSQLQEGLIGIACNFIINCQFSCVLRNGFKSSVNFLMTLIFFIVDNSRK